MAQCCRSLLPLVSYFAAPVLVTTLGVQLLGPSVKWMDINGAIQNICQRDLAGVWPRTITSIICWIMISLVAGIWVTT